MRSGRIVGSQMGTDRRERATIIVCGLGIALVLLVMGGTTRQRRQVERAEELFRQRTVVDEYCFDHTMSFVACTGNPYAEF